MTIFSWNIYEKSFTPYYASLAPKHLVHRHKVSREKSRVSAFFQDSKTKSVVRFINRKIQRKPYWYLLSIMMFAFCYEQAIKKPLIAIYKLKNQEHSLKTAQQNEKEYQEWRRKTYPEEFEDEEEEEEVEAVVEEEDDE